MGHGASNSQKFDGVGIGNSALSTSAGCDEPNTSGLIGHVFGVSPFTWLRKKQ